MTNHDYLTTIAEIAMNFKNHGTENHMVGKYREALGFYTQGLEAAPEDAQIRESLLLNRSACNLILGEWSSVFPSRHFPS